MSWHDDTNPFNPANEVEGHEVDEREMCYNLNCEHRVVPGYIGCAKHEHEACIEEGDETPKEIRQQAKEDGIELN